MAVTRMVGVPMQRDEKLGTRNVLSDEDFAARQKQAAAEEQDNAEFDPRRPRTPRGDVGDPCHPAALLERGQPQRQASLIVDPPNGRMPPFTAADPRPPGRAACIPADTRPGGFLHGPQATTIGASRAARGSILPVIYNNGTRSCSRPATWPSSNEMIHETRVVPLDGRPHASPTIKMWLGDSAGASRATRSSSRPTNFTDRTGVGVNGGGQRHSEA